MTMDIPKVKCTKHCHYISLSVTLGKKSHKKHWCRKRSQRITFMTRALRQLRRTGIVLTALFQPRNLEWQILFVCFCLFCLFLFLVFFSGGVFVVIFWITCKWWLQSVNYFYSYHIYHIISFSEKKFYHKDLFLVNSLVYLYTCSFCFKAVSRVTGSLLSVMHVIP